MSWLMLMPPALAGLALPAVLLRFSPGATRAELLVGAPVLAFGIGLGWLAIAWVTVFLLAPLAGGAITHLPGPAGLIAIAVAGVFASPVCALIGGLWVTRTHSGKG